MDTVNLIARLLLAQIFVLSGLSKMGAGYAGIQGYMGSMGVPGALLPLVIALEVAGGFALVIGFWTRCTALALAAFTLIAGLIFHHNFADQVQLVMFMKNVAITGGLLMVYVHGPGRLSLDARRRS